MLDWLLSPRLPMWAIFSPFQDLKKATDNTLILFGQEFSNGSLPSFQWGFAGSQGTKDRTTRPCLEGPGWITVQHNELDEVYVVYRYI